MPILPAEPDLFPDDLWRVDLAGEQDHRWWCLHAKPRQEKAVARELRVRRVSYYLPMVLQESRTPGGRKIRSLAPLFSGYLFLRGDDGHRSEALKGGRLVNVLEVADQAGLESDLRQIHQMICSGMAVIPEPTHPVGAKIRILSGPMAGIVGTVIRRGNTERFVASVRFLGRGAAVELADWQVERVDG